MQESRPERSALGAAPDITTVSSRRWLQFYTSVMSKSLTELLKNHTSKQTNGPSTISESDFAQEGCFDLHKRDLFLRPDQNMKLGIGFA